MKKIANCLFSLIEKSRVYVSKHAVVQGFLGNFFPIAYANLIYVSLMTLDIVSQNTFKINTIVLLLLSLIVILMYSINAEIVYKTKKEMREGILINSVNNVIGAIGFGFIFQIF